MATTDLSLDQLENTISNNDIVMIDFWAQWCGPCKMFGPVFEQASEKYPDIAFTKVNTEEDPDMAAHFGVRSIPTLAIFRDKILLYKQAGAPARGRPGGSHHQGQGTGHGRNSGPDRQGRTPRGLKAEIPWVFGKSYSEHPKDRPLSLDWGATNPAGAGAEKNTNIVTWKRIRSLNPVKTPVPATNSVEAAERRRVRRVLRAGGNPFCKKGFPRTIFLKTSSRMPCILF